MPRVGGATERNAGVSRRAVRRLAAALLLLAVAALGAVWLARRPLADRLVTRELAARGIEARYVIEAIDARRAVLRGVRLGPRARPDLVARAIIVDYGWGLPPTPRAILLDGAVLRARAGPGGISFGSLDALIPPGRSTRLPDVAVAIPNGTILLDTPAGAVMLRVAAEGWLPDGWRGRFGMAPATLRAGGCVAADAGAAFDVATKRHRIDIAGAGGAARLACTGATARAVAWDGRVVVPADLATAGGVLRVAGADLAAAGLAADEFELGGAFGGAAVAPRGDWRAILVRPRFGEVGATRLDADGDFVAALEAGSLRASGEAVLAGAAIRVPALRRAPEPFARTARSLTVALEDAELRAPFTVTVERTGWSARVTRFDAAAASGALAGFAGGDGVWLGPGGAVVDGVLRVAGGGLPATTLRLEGLRSGGGGRGRLTIAAWRDRGAVLGPVAADLALAGDTLAVDGRARFSGRAGAATIDRLDAPLDAAFNLATGALALGRRCAEWRVAGIAAGDARLEGVTLRACPRGSAALTLRDGRLGGTFSVAPLTLAGVVDAARFTLRAGQPLDLSPRGTTDAPALAFRAPGLTVATSRAAVAGDLDGVARFGDDGLRGEGRVAAARLVRADVEGSAVPVAVDMVAAAWRLDGGGVALSGLTARVRDREARPRFAPMRVVDADATLRGGALAATGALRLVDPDAQLATFTARHDLAGGSGALDYAAALTFAPALQPFQLSELARGVVENADGLVALEGRIAWSGGALATPATLRLGAVSFATAALGPVERLGGTLVFTDLANLVTEPGQRLTIGALNPGVRVADGVATLRLTGGGAAAIDAIVWPFAGGVLTLRPTIIAPDAPARELTLDVAGIDAEAFLATFDIPDLRVTGRFDGVLPLVFDAAGGRIAGGRLTARAPGGVIQYVGAAGGTLDGGARLAFDALRSLRYDDLALRFDGALDGELVTAIDFTGANLLPARLPGALPLRAAGLPFKFGVSVRAPFRALLGTAASFSDVRARIREGAAAEQE